MTGKNLETKKLNSSLNSGSVVSSTTPVVYYCNQIKKTIAFKIRFFSTTRWICLNLHLWQPWGQETDLDRDVCRLTPIVGWQTLPLQHFHLEKTGSLQHSLILDWPDQDWQWHTHLKLSSRFTVCEPHRNPARSQKYLKTKPVEKFEIWPVLTDGWFDRSTCQELQAAGWHTDHEEELIAVCKQISFFLWRN